MLLSIFKKLSVILGVFLSHSSIAGAQGYVPLTTLPGVTSTGTSLGEYLAAIFNIGIGIAGVLAVLMIVVAGIEFIGGASSVSARKDAKDRIFNALFGLLLAMGSWLIVYTINPTLIGGTLSIVGVTGGGGGTGTLVSPGAPGGTAGGVVGPGAGVTPGPGTPGGSFGGGSGSVGGGSAPGAGAAGGTGSTGAGSVGSGITPGAGILGGTGIGSIGGTSLITVTLSDPSNDIAILTDCLSSSAIPPCDVADVNSDGDIDVTDFSLFLDAFRYDVSGDGIIDLGSSSSITHCFFKENINPIPMPSYCCNLGDGSCNFGFGTDQYACISSIPVSFPTKCAIDNHNSKSFSMGELGQFKSVINSSVSGSKQVDLRNLYINLFACSDGSGFCSFFSDVTLGRITYSTIIQYDTNNDGIADFSGSGLDPVEDFNGDGLINAKDSDFIDFMNEEIFGSTGFIPLGFTLGTIEAFIFDNSGFTDKQIIEYCIGKTPLMGCALADINGDGSVTNADLNQFNTNTSLYDINNDGLVHISSSGGTLSGTLADTTPPSITLSTPSGVLPETTTKATLTVNTSEVASCRFDVKPDKMYEKMTGFDVTTGLSSSHDVTVLPGGSYLYYVKCKDLVGNISSVPGLIAFSVSSIGVSIAPPSITLAGPTGVLFESPETVNLSVFTDKAANCRFDTSAGQPYVSMAEFNTTNSILSMHEVPVTVGGSYLYYVKCADEFGNVTPGDHEISFSVSY